MCSHILIPTQFSIFWPQSIQHIHSSWLGSIPPVHAQFTSQGRLTLRERVFVHVYAGVGGHESEGSLCVRVFVCVCVGNPQSLPPPSRLSHTFSLCIASPRCRRHLFCLCLSVLLVSSSVRLRVHLNTWVCLHSFHSRQLLGVYMLFILYCHISQPRWLAYILIVSPY